jgi:hypothetical protein
MKRREIHPDLICNPLFPDLTIEDPDKMADMNIPLVPFPKKGIEVFIDPFPEFRVFLDLVTGFCQRAAARAAKGTERIAFLFSEGQVTGGHEKVSVAVN